MTSSNVPFESSNPDAEAAEFLGFNLEALSGLAAFVDLSEGFTLGFVETNFARSTDWIVAALKHHPHCQAVQIETVALDDPNLRSLLEELQRIVPTISRLPDKKLVLVVSGLERAIGILGDYTPFVATLNFERDMLAAQIPHPVILVLPDYAMTRIARYAVDFWSWSSGRFRFGADRGQVEVMRSQVWDPTGRLSSDLAPVKRERIALLEQLLMDCAPSGREVAAADVGNCLRILLELGDSYRSLANYPTARAYYQRALELAQEQGKRQREADALLNLGRALPWWNQALQAREYYEAAMEIYRQVGDRLGEANALDSLALASFAAGNYQQALDFHQQALDIFNLIESRYDIAWSLRYLGRTQLKLGDPLTAINFFEQAKSLFENLGMTETANACQQEIQQINQNSNPSAGSVPDI